MLNRMSIWLNILLSIHAIYSKNIKKQNVLTNFQKHKPIRIITEKKLFSACNAIHSKRYSEAKLDRKTYSLRSSCSSHFL